MATTETTETTTAAIIINSSQQYASLLPRLSTSFYSDIFAWRYNAICSKIGNKRAQYIRKDIWKSLLCGSTIGSIVGTFLTVYVLIPIFEIKYIFYALGLVLIILSSVIGLRTVPKILAGSIVILLVLTNTVFLVVSTSSSSSPLSSSSNTHSHPGTLVYQKETPYSHLDVVDLGFNNTIRQCFT